MTTHKNTARQRTLLFLLPLLGFTTACEKEREGSITTMYGSPRVDVAISGRVTAADGTPVPGIKVSDNGGRPATTATDANGHYELKNSCGTALVKYTFTDTDGAANGGDFAAKEVRVLFTEEDRTEKEDGWYRGAFARTGIDVTLEEKE